VDGFLAAQLHLRKRPAHRRMKPEDGPDDLFEKRPDPVAARDVHQLVTNDGTLDVERKLAQSRRQQHDRASPPERHRLRQTLVPTQLGVWRQVAVEHRQTLVQYRSLAGPANPPETKQ